MHKLMCTFMTPMKKKKIPDRNLDTSCLAGIPCNKASILKNNAIYCFVFYCFFLFVVLNYLWKSMVTTNFLFGFQQPLLKSSFPHSHKLRKNTSVLAGTIPPPPPPPPPLRRCSALPSSLSCDLLPRLNFASHVLILLRQWVVFWGWGWFTIGLVQRLGLWTEIGAVVFLRVCSFWDYCRIFTYIVGIHRVHVLLGPILFSEWTE